MQQTAFLVGAVYNTRPHTREFRACFQCYIVCNDITFTLPCDTIYLNNTLIAQENAMCNLFSHNENHNTNWHMVITN